MRNYSSRAEKAYFLFENYKQFLGGKVLDVGCGEAYLRDFVRRSQYVGIDIIGNPDVLIDLEQGVLPFQANTFDCVVCTDVLEHLENIHNLFDELIRVSAKYVIISLPNPAGAAWPRIIRGNNIGKFYGLPPTKPVDRHRWFFNYQQARLFIEERARENLASVRELRPLPFEGKRGFVGKLIEETIKRIRGSTSDCYLNLYAKAIWAVLEKKRE